MAHANPVSTLADAVVMPFKAVFVVALCAGINAMTFSGHWWFKWVALGMGIATVVALARAVKTVLLLALLAWAATWVARRWGQPAGARFNAWAAGLQPQAAGPTGATAAPL